MNIFFQDNFTSSKNKNILRPYRAFIYKGMTEEICIIEGILQYNC